MDSVRELPWVAWVGANLLASASDPQGMVRSGKFALTCFILDVIYSCLPASVSAQRTILAADPVGLFGFNSYTIRICCHIRVKTRYGNVFQKEAPMNPNPLQPTVIPLDAGRVLHSLGVRNKLTEQHTGGAIYVFDSEFEPGASNRLHVHRFEDKLAYVVEGALADRLGDQELEVRAGGIAYLP
jgi:hypothetical protein